MDSRARTDRLVFDYANTLYRRGGGAGGGGGGVWRSAADKAGSAVGGPAGEGDGGAAGWADGAERKPVCPENAIRRLLPRLRPIRRRQHNPTRDDGPAAARRRGPSRGHIIQSIANNGNGGEARAVTIKTALGADNARKDRLFSLENSV